MYLRSQTKQRYALTHTMQLRDVWAAESSKQGGTGRIDVLSWLSRATLDIIGLAGQYFLAILPRNRSSLLSTSGFNYRFNALSDEQNELSDAFAQMFRAGQKLTIIPFLRGFFPFLRFLVSGLSINLSIPGMINMKKNLA